jgi:hypothetical protein
VDCVWVELTTLNGENLLTGNHYFPPSTVNYFYFLGSILDTKNCQLFYLGISIPLVLIGSMGCLCLIVIIILNYKAMLHTLRVFWD